MAKRAASKQLTHDNWDDEDDEKETPGTYRSVEASVLQSRVIKKAKRTLPQAEEKASSAPLRSPFTHFTGFGKTLGKTPGFGIFKMNCEQLCSPGTKQNGSKSLKIELAEKGSVSPLTSEKLSESYLPAKDSGSPSWKKYESRDVEYYRQLKALNDSLMQWIEMHLSKNPWCDFTPVFDDYRKHLGMIEKKYPLKVKPSPYLPKPFSFKVPSAPVQKLYNVASDEKFSGEPVSKMTKLEPSTFPTEETTGSPEMRYGAGFKSNTTNTSTFSFGIKATTTATVPSSNSGPTSSCGSAEKDAPDHEKKTPFTFSFAKSAEKPSDIARQCGEPDSKTFAGSPLAKPKDSDSQPNSETNEDEYVPPKNEVTIVKEEDAVYSKKCRLFYKKDGSYTEKGVGMLYLKPMGGKTQLLIRADTNLGNILLNIKLSASLPMQRMGKNNVLVVCVPNPPVTPDNSDSKETAPLLIRVKTGDDADELFDMLNKYKS